MCCATPPRQRDYAPACGDFWWCTLRNGIGKNWIEGLIMRPRIGNSGASTMVRGAVVIRPGVSSEVLWARLSSAYIAPCATSQLRAEGVGEVGWGGEPHEDGGGVDGDVAAGGYVQAVRLVGTQAQLLRRRGDAHAHRLHRLTAAPAEERGAARAAGEEGLVARRGRDEDSGVAQGGAVAGGAGRDGDVRRELHRRGARRDGRGQGPGLRGVDSGLVGVGAGTALQRGAGEGVGAAVARGRVVQQRERQYRGLPAHPDGRGEWGRPSRGVVIK